MKKLIGILLITPLLLSGCFKSEFNNEFQKKNDNPTFSKSGEVDYNRRDESFSNNNNKRFNFNKDIVLISIDEDSDSSMKNRPMGGIASESAYIMDNELYFFDDSELPTLDSELIVLENTYGQLDYLLNSNIYIENSNNINVTINLIDDEIITNENRLFINKDLNVKIIDKSLVEISIDNEKSTLKSGESKVFMRESGSIKTKLTVTNHGLFNSNKDMWYKKLNY